MTTFKLQPVNDQAPNCAALIITDRTKQTKSVVIDHQEILQLKEAIKEYFSEI